MKIGLLTPYTGGNLGDGAIQEAVIANIRARFPDVRIHGFTLSPEKTEKLHRIPCFPLTAFSIRHYCKPSASIQGEGGVPEEQEAGSVQRMKDLIKKMPLLFRTLKMVQQGATALSYLAAEVLLIGRSYRILKDHDFLIVSGGGQLDDYWGGPWGHPYNLLKWGLLARATRTPYVFLSVGTCALESRLSVSFIKWALKLASYRSYRDQRSRELLQQIAFTRNDSVWPDLAFSRDIPAGERPSAGEGGPFVVGISPIAYLSPRSWPKENLLTYQRYMKILTDFVSCLLRDRHSVVLFHTDTSDKWAVKELREALHEQAPDNSAVTIVEAPMGNVEEHLSLMAKLDCVVASRLHGVILAHLVNTPVLAISYDRKVTTYMEEVEQAGYCLDIHNFEPDALRNKFLALQSDRKAAASIAVKAAQFRGALAAQYDHVLHPHAGSEGCP